MWAINGFHLPKDYAFGAFYRFSFNRHWAIRAQFNYGYIRNADSLSDMVARQNRNLSFQSTIMEASLMMEFNFLEFEPGTRFTHTPYVMGGIGAFRFNPTTQYQGQTYELRELGH
ncbi:MAG: DUF6089 family protein [Owenweeksia sp.]|nr:DUF6089 family protein [Owenweeksia sp.]